MNHKTIASGCPGRVMVRDSWCCKALLGQPSGDKCGADNCLGLHIADLLMNELRNDILRKIEELGAERYKERRRHG